jgi:3D-(3,5/4)-trihydroxycyclohexane-1,2-dione acylhydrolase (decyclizing)
VTGTPGANIAAREADLILGIGTRYSDFTSASKTAFQNPAVRFININVAEFDAYKHAALPLVGDARLTITELQQALGEFSIEAGYRAKINGFRARWENEVDRIYGLRQPPPITQGEVIGIVNNFTKPSDIVVCAAGSLPGDLHKLWRTRQPGGYHMEYGFSCMGYEIAGGLGAKMADPAREVYVLVGDGSYLMMAQEIVTSIQEGFKINIVLLDNHGFSSIGGLSRACGNEGMGTNYRYRRGEKYDGDPLRVDFAANAASLGAWTARAQTADELKTALTAAREQRRTSVVVIETSYDERVPGYESWWDVPIAEVSERDAAKAARRSYEEARRKERFFF